MTREEDRQAHIEAFDAEADAPRPGWERDPGAGRIELWAKVLPGGFLASVVAMKGGGAMFVVRDADGRRITTGESSRLGWAMDGAESEGQERLQ